MPDYRRLYQDADDDYLFGTIRPVIHLLDNKERLRRYSVEALITYQDMKIMQAECRMWESPAPAADDQNKLAKKVAHLEA